jgi:TP901 family phage tail tape measure protein
MSQVIGTAVMEIAADLSKFEQSIDEMKTSIGSKLSGITSTIGGAFTKMGASMSAISLPVGGFLFSAFKTAADFESQMRLLQAVTGATNDEIGRMAEQAKKLGAETIFSASQAAAAQIELAKAGLSVDEVMAALPSTMQLAAAGQLDLAEAASITASIMNIFGASGQDLQHINDVLAKAANASATGVREIGTAMAYVGPLAAQLKIPVEEVVGAIALLSNAGIDASMAGTALRGAISNLISPTKQQAEIIEKLGLKVFDAEGKFVGLRSIIEQLEQSGADAAIIMELFGDRAGPAMAALLSQGSDALKNMTTELENADGTASKMAESGMGGLNGALQELQGAWESLQLALADSGALEMVADLVNKFAEGIRKVGNWLQSLDPRVRTFILAVAGIVAAFGPLLLMLGGFMFMLGFLMSPLGLFALALLLVLIAIVAIVLFWPEIEKFFTNLGQKLQGVGEAIVGFFTNIPNMIQEHWPEIVGIILGPLGMILFNSFGFRDKLIEIFGTVKDKVVEKLGELKSGAMEKLNELWDTIQGIPGKILEKLGDLGSLLIEAGEKLIQGLIDGIMNKIPGLDTVVGKAKGVLNKINPFSRFSPPLVEQVRLGAQEIMRTYQGMDIRLRASLSGIKESLGGVALEGGMATAPQVVVNVEGPVFGELGFDRWLTDRLYEVLRRNAGTITAR